MKISKHDKLLLFEQEFVMLLLVVLLGILFNFMSGNVMFYLSALVVGFIFYFWMVYEEKIHTSGLKHDYFEHTSSYIMIAQTAIALHLVAMMQNWKFFQIFCVVAAVIMYSISFSRIILFKVVFKNEHQARQA